MMSPDNFVYDAASALSQGSREQQEDAVVADFSVGSDFGFAVLADGMGGHAAGEIASGIVVTEVFSELKLLGDDTGTLESEIQDVLHNAVAGANQCVELYARQNPAAKGMGSTLVVPVLFSNRLYWISIGDSPLYLFRDKNLLRLNEDHSMAAQIEKLQEQGLIKPDEAINHPDRECLTSVLAGADIPQIDCRDTPFTLREDDILIVASDGLQFLSEEQIADVLATARTLPSAQISARLLRLVKELDHPDQDNISLCVVKLARIETSSQTDAPAPIANVVSVANQKRRKSNFIRISARSDEAGESSVVSISSKAVSR
jgi:PPM family protein phosphatase